MSFFRKWSELSFEYYRELVTGPDAGKAGAMIMTGVFLTRQPFPVRVCTVSLAKRKYVFWVSDKDRYKPLSQKKARVLKVWILEKEALHYTCSVNKCADHLCCYCTVYLLLCFRI